MKKIALYIILFICPVIMYGQNLVHNPSMEEYYDCFQSFTHEPENAYYWYDPTEMSSDYLNECHNNNVYGTGYEIPQNMYGYQWARTGKAYMFFGTVLNWNNYREHITVKLKDTLINGETYCVSLYVSLADYSNYAIDDIGFLFTKDSINFPVLPPPAGSPLTGWIPQYTNHNKGIIANTLNWVKIEGSFIASGGGEEFLTIGSFMYDSLINYQNIGDTSMLSAGYYIDDVSVYSCDADVSVADGGSDVELCYGDDVVLGTHDLGDYMYWWYDEYGNLIDSVGYLTVSPEITTTYKLVVKDFKFEETVDYVTVYVEDCATFVPNIFSPNGDGNNDVLHVMSNYIQRMHFSIYNRWGEVVFESKDINNGWNGEYKGAACEPSVFVWYLEAVMTNGEEIWRKGNVTLVR
jgi:gliding motility-associated-like protein